MLWDFRLSRAVAAVARTWPFVALRLGVYFGFAFAYLLVTGIGAGVGYGLGAFSDEPGAWALGGGLIGFGATGAALYLAREYILYIVKAGHIAVLVEVHDGRAIPADRGQIRFAQQIVKDRFVEASVLFAVDQLVKGVLRIITGTLHAITAFIPIAGLQALVRFVNAVLRISLTYVDEIILAYNIRVGSANPWESSRAALVLYAQNYRGFLRNAVWLAAFMWGLTFLIFLVLLAPAGAIAGLYPGALASFGFVLAIIFAWSFKAAVLEPIAIAALMEVYFKTIQGQVPDPEWDARLASASARFRALKDRAASAMTGAAKSQGTQA